MQILECACAYMSPFDPYVTMDTEGHANAVRGKRMSSEAYFDNVPTIDSHSADPHLHAPASKSSLPSCYSVPSSVFTPGFTGTLKLPAVKILKPAGEYQSSREESWPLSAIHHSSSAHSTPGEHSSAHMLFPPQSNNAIHSAGSTKPKFLGQLESYLKKELRLLGCPSSGPHELRLQAHKEVFEYLIEDFKTYKPLLSAIKNEYELYLSYLEEMVRELRPMRGHLETVREECERRIMALKQEDKLGEAKVMQENKELRDIIKSLRNEELAYQAQIEKLQSEIAKTYQQYRDESDARKILLADYNDLKFRQQEQKGEDSTSPDDIEDPVILKLKLMRAREDLKVSNQRINTMLADYGDVIPRKEYDSLEASATIMETEMEVLKGDHAALIEEHGTLQSLCKETEVGRRRLNTELEKLRRCATPRPDWDRCKLYVKGGSELWNSLSEGRSSDDKLDILLAQIAGVDESQLARGDPFVGMGTGSDVPRYLRVEEKTPIKNRRISSKELNIFISGFWQHRLTTEKTPSLPLDEDLHLFLLSQYGDAGERKETLAIEDGYNLQDACSRFVHQSHVALFKNILEGKYQEDLFTVWLGLQRALTDAFSKQEVMQGMISADALPAILQSILKGKPALHLKLLNSRAVQICSGTPGIINFDLLLTPGLDGRPGEFSLLLLEQYLQESEALVEEIAQELEKKESVSLIEMQRILQHMCTSKSYEDNLLTLSYVFSISTEEVFVDGSSQMVDISIPTLQALEKLNEMVVHR